MDVFYIKKTITKHVTLFKKWYKNVVFSTDEYVCSVQTVKIVQIVTRRSNICP